MHQRLLETTQIQPGLNEATIDSDELIDQVWRDLSSATSRAIVAQTVNKLLVKYDDATISRFVPVLVRREAFELLRWANKIDKAHPPIESAAFE